jgi:hypothetical protein
VLRLRIRGVGFDQRASNFHRVCGSLEVKPELRHTVHGIECAALRSQCLQSRRRNLLGTCIVICAAQESARPPARCARICAFGTQGIGDGQRALGSHLGGKLLCAPPTVFGIAQEAGNNVVSGDGLGQTLRELFWSLRVVDRKCLEFLEHRHERANHFVRPTLSLPARGQVPLLIGATALLAPLVSFPAHMILGIVMACWPPLLLRRPRGRRSRSARHSTHAPSGR